MRRGCGLQHPNLLPLQSSRAVERSCIGCSGVQVTTAQVVRQKSRYGFLLFWPCRHRLGRSCAGPHNPQGALRQTKDQNVLDSSHLLFRIKETPTDLVKVQISKFPNVLTANKIEEDVSFFLMYILYTV